MIKANGPTHELTIFSFIKIIGLFNDHKLEISPNDLKILEKLIKTIEENLNSILHVNITDHYNDLKRKNKFDVNNLEKFKLIVNKA